MKIDSGNVSHLRHVSGTELLGGNSNDLKLLLKKVKGECAETGLQLYLKRTKMMTAEEFRNCNMNSEEI